MYCGFFGLRCPPFEDRADPQFTYATSLFEEALAALEYEAHFGQGMTLALGEAGTGKTQLIRSLLMRLHSTDHAVVVTWPVGGEMDLVRETCKGFGVTLSSSHGSVQQPARLRRHLSRNNRANHRSILIIDQAENMTADNLLQLGTLADLEGDTGTLLNILLVGQPQFRTLMDRPEFARLRQQLFGERTLSPLTPADTTNYLRHRLSVAGAADPDLFDDQAVELIHQAAGGIPRLINRMADAALIAAYGAQVTRVNGDIAAEVTRNDTILERSMDRTEVGVATAGHFGADRRAGATTFRPAIDTAKNLHGADSWDLPGTVAAASDEGPTVDIEDPAGGDFPDADEMDSSSYAPLLEPVASFHARGEALLERLQRALARAERFSATSNASLSQFTAVEKHLHSLTTRAERLIDRVGGAVRHGSDSLDQQQSRVGQAVHAAQRHATRLDGQLSRAAEIDNDMKEHVRRLERACERADQVESRVGSLAGQFADKADDVQERVTLLMTCLQGAENAHAKLDGLIQRAPKLLDDTNQTARQLREKLQEGIEKAEQTLAATTEASKKAGVVSVDLNKTLGKAGQFADKADDVQERVTLLMTCLQDAENVHAKLDGLIQRAPKLLDDTNQTARQLREELQKGIEKAEQTLAATTEASKKAGAMSEVLNKTIGKTEEVEEQFIGRLLAKSEARLKDRLAALEKVARGSVAEAQRGLDRIAHKAAAITDDIERRIRAFDAKLEDSIARSSRFESAFTEGAAKRCKEKLQEQLERHLQAQSESASTILAGHRANMEGTIRLHRDQVHGLEERVQALAVHEEKLVSTIGAMEQDAERTGKRVQQLGQAVGTARSSVEALSDRAERAESNLAATVNHSEKLVAEVQTARVQIEAVQQNTASTLVEIGRICERVQASHEQAHACEQAASRLQLEHTAGESLAGKLHDTVARATQIQAALQACVTDGGSKLKQLDSHHAAALRILGELSEANVTAHEAVEQTRVATASAEKTVAAAREENARLVTHAAEGSQVREQLAEVNSTGRQLHEAIQGSIAHADEKLTRLGNEHDVAQRLVQELHSASAAGQNQIKNAARATSDAEQRVAEAVGKVDRLLEDAWSLSAKSQTDTAELCEQSDRAAGLVETLTKSIGPCEIVATQLSRHMEKAGRLEKGLSEENEKAGKLAGRLAAAGRLLASAKEIESTAKRAAEDTRDTYDNLIAESETAKNHIDRMQELGLVSRELIDSQNRLHREAEGSSTRLSEQVANAQDAIDSGQQVFAGFVTQAEMFEDQLKNLADKTQQMERTISEATSKPDSIVQSAKFQAAKLEQVCGAVRKVFAGLSRTSLEAHQQTEQMRQTGQDASRRIAELTIQTQRETKRIQQAGQEVSRRLAELTIQTQRETKRIQQTGQDTSRRLAELTVQTQRAAGTLQEWVEEAVRVQSRLDRTLGECPSIRETHPSQTIRQLSEARFPIQDIGEARLGGALEMLRDPEPRTKPKESAATQPPTRTEQVAQLIEQAKQSAPAT